MNLCTFKECKIGREKSVIRGKTALGFTVVMRNGPKKSDIITDESNYHKKA